MRRGFILVEVSITYLILSLALVALIPVFILAIRAAKNTEQIEAATQLSVELIEEIRLRKWDEATPIPQAYITGPGPIGVNTGEVASDKRTFDDIDDFNGWSENPPMDPMMNPLSAFSAYSRTVTVQYVDPSLNPAASATDYKKVTACTSSANLKPLCMDTVFTNR